MRQFAKFGDRSKYGKRHTPGVMNKTEELCAEILEVRKRAGEIVAWWFESMTFKLADDCRYTPDFVVLFTDGSMECIDAKGAGPMDPKSLVKAKCAAEKFFPFRFVIEQTADEEEWWRLETNRVLAP